MKLRYWKLIKEINAIKTQLVVTTGTNLFQHWMQKKFKTEPRARHNSTQSSKRRGYVFIRLTALGAY